MGLDGSGKFLMALMEIACTYDNKGDDTDDALISTNDSVARSKSVSTFCSSLLRDPQSTGVCCHADCSVRVLRTTCFFHILFQLSVNQSPEEG
jgi:hypothetical protein